MGPGLGGGVSGDTPPPAVSPPALGGYSAAAPRSRAWAAVLHLALVQQCSPIVALRPPQGNSSAELVDDGKTTELFFP